MNPHFFTAPFVVGFRVSPWGVPLLDYDGKPHLNEKLEMRNAKWWCGA